MDKLNHEVRFEITKDITEALLDIGNTLGKKKNDFARCLMLYGLEKVQEELIKNKKQIVFAPIPNSVIQKIRVEEKK